MRSLQITRLGCSLALAGLMVRLVVAFLHVPIALAANLSSAGSDFNIVYCQVFGSNRSPGALGSKPGDSDDAPDQQNLPLCPLCQAMSVSAFAIAPDAVGSLMPPATIVVKRVAEAARASKRRARIHTTARGPPSLQA